MTVETTDWSFLDNVINLEYLPDNNFCFVAQTSAGVQVCFWVAQSGHARRIRLWHCFNPKVAAIAWHLTKDLIQTPSDNRFFKRVARFIQWLV